MPFLRKYATGTHVYLPMIKRGVVDFAVGADWTPATGDVKVSIDGAAVANIGTLPAAIAAGNGAFWDFTIASGEVTGKKITITVADAATKAVEDQCFVIETYGHASAEYQADFSLPNLPANVTTWMGGAPNALIQGRVDSLVQIETGTAQAGTGGSITLRAGASAVDSYYVDAWIAIVAGAGAGQARLIGSYVGASKVAQVNAWNTNPDDTSVYAIFPAHRVDVQNWLGSTAPTMTGDAYARLGAPAGPSVSADVAAIKAVDDAVKAKTDNLPASPAAVGSAMTLTSGERNAVADAYLDRTDGVETGITPRKQMRLSAAVDGGKLAGAATASVTIRDATDAKDRVVATVDADGNRTAVTLDLT